jgi:hypothetical protein
MKVRQIKDLQLRSTSERVGAHLSELYDGTEAGRATLHIEDQFRAIAARLGMTPETWSRSLRRLESVGVRAKGHRIEIEDVAQLRDTSGFDGLRRPRVRSRCPRSDLNHYAVAGNRT